ncbi:MAG: hypothetical protein IKS33_06815 [Bacteroidales bacterium]|nr:hypothetical protein [Bacteroidales bacterium]MBQ4478571.1 hypothetical protein [Bacteroidales bacterium]MBR4453952.1 hypothetical protein [Bacteroidales bacterium]
MKGKTRWNMKVSLSALILIVSIAVMVIIAIYKNDDMFENTVTRYGKEIVGRLDKYQKKHQTLPKDLLVLYPDDESIEELFHYQIINDTTYELSFVLKDGQTKVYQSTTKQWTKH